MKADEKVLSTNLFPVVGIGASAGGLEAFRKLLKAIPEKSGIAYVLVQHLAPNHESLLPDLLQKVTTIPVVEISDDIKVEPDHIYILPSNKMLVANDGILQLSPRVTQKNELNLPIDIFFTSLAEVHQSHAIGVVLSGTGSDGTGGLKAIKDYGGITFAQDEASAAYEGMPKSAIEAGVVDFILPPDEIPQKLSDIIRILRSDSTKDPNAEETEKELVKQILAVLRIRKGTDFTYYKQTTVRRRILRRMAINKNEDTAAYLFFLKDNKQEQDALYQDLLIPVTSFFRDPQVFDNLCETVFPLILKNKSAGEAIRIWIAGCSTGQEAYSMAMCLTEFLGNTTERVQLFASDLSEPAIAKARIGTYSKSEIESLTPERLQKFFVKKNGNYQINKSVRDMCVFATHNFLKDPPFSKMDLISCRNVMIYLEPYLQKKAFTTFHYSLNPKGYLLLGKLETVSSVPDLFSMAAKDDKVFTRKEGPGRFMPMAGQRSELNLSFTHSKNENMRTDFQKIADDLILSRYTPAGVVINEDMDIVHFRGITGPYLEQTSGKPTHNLLLLAKHGLAFELRNLLYKAKKDKARVIKEIIPFRTDGILRTISIEILPLPGTPEQHYLILFHEINAVDSLPPTGRPKKATKTVLDDKDLRIRQFEQELIQTREDMRAITQDQEALSEELQSANEELLSGNEELQSLNEELETGKEELQSTNEELTVVNRELSSLNEQITTARDYAEGIIATIREPLLVLDKHLRVKTANLSYYNAFKVNAADTEGKLIYEIGHKDWNIPVLKELLENILPEKSTFDNLELTHTFYNIGERRMRLNAREIKEGNSEKLILLAIEDITEQARAEEARVEIQKRYQFITNSIPQKVWATDEEGNLNFFNDVWLDYTGLSVDELKEWGWKKIIHPDEWEEYKGKWQHSLATSTEFELEHRLLNKEGEYRWHLSRGLAYKAEDGKPSMLWVGTHTEIQQHKKLKDELKKAVIERTSELKEANEKLVEKNNSLQKLIKELESFSYVASHDLQEPLRKIQLLARYIDDHESQNLTAGGKDYFRRILNSAERMQQLINDLLLFTRFNIEARKFESTNLRPIVEEVLNELSESIQEKHATFDLAHLGSAPVIAFQFRQLLQNLIGNALKFSSPNRPPHVVIKSRIVSGDKLKNEKLLPEKKYYHVTVTDNGIGFDPQYSERIFEVFQRLHEHEQYKGTGIGLAIVKKIVENHNGIITATGKPDKGAQFDIYIPAQ